MSIPVYLCVGTGISEFQIVGKFWRRFAVQVFRSKRDFFFIFRLISKMDDKFLDINTYIIYIQLLSRKKSMLVEEGFL